MTRLDTRSGMQRISTRHQKSARRIRSNHHGKGSFGEVNLQIIGTKSSRMTETLHGRTYYASYEGRIHHYDIKPETLDVLCKARERIYAAFEVGADPEFYHCPYCGNRDLQEVYGRRVYKCAGCNDRLMTEEEFMYARTGRLRRARHTLVTLIASRASNRD